MEKNFCLIALVWFNSFFWQSNIQLRSKHTSLRIIKLYLSIFAEKETLLKQEKREIIEITEKKDSYIFFKIFLWEKLMIIFKIK